MHEIINKTDKTMKGIQFKLFTMLVFLLLSTFSSADEPEMFYVEFMNFSRVQK